MNTAAHVIFGAAAFARPGDRRVTMAAVAGSLLPDVSLYFMVGWQSWAMGRTPEQVFGYDYREPFWQSIFAVDNSIVIWACLLILALALARPWAVALTGAALLHVSIDFLLHNSDARMHFWPLSDWVFHSPVSYWDPAHFGGMVGVVELAACIALGLLLCWRFRGVYARSLVALSVSLEVVPTVLLPILFASH